MSSESIDVTRDYAWSARVFYGFALVVLVDSVLAAEFNPSRHETFFQFELVTINGGLFVGLLWIARRLSRGAGVAAAYWLLGILSGLVVIGAMIQMTGSYPETKPFAGMQLMSAARAASGLYVLLVWGVLVRDSVLKRSRKSQRAG